MGLLDALFAGSQDSGGGLLGGLPSSWQYQNPQDAIDRAKLVEASRNLVDNYGIGSPGQLPTAGSPFGPVPQFAPPQPPSIFGAVPQAGTGPSMGPIGTMPGAPGPIAGMFMPQGGASSVPQPQAPAPLPAQTIGTPSQPPAPQDMPTRTMNIGGQGGYQMPQFGSAADYTPQARPTDVSAQSRQQAPDQPMQLPPALGGGSATSFLGRIGSPDSLLGRLAGNDTRSIQQQNLKAQYDSTRQALIANGVPEQQANSTAMLSVLNPEAAKTVLPELLSNRQELVKLKGPFGEEIPKVYSKTEHTLTDPEGYQAQNGGPVSAITDKIITARNAGATKDQLLAFVPPAYRDDLSALTSYKALPASMGRSEVRGQLVAMAHAVDPNFDESLIPTRIQMRKDFAGEGKNGQAIGAFNTVQHHAGQVSDAIEEFEKAGGGSDYPLLNAGKLMLANQTGMNPKLRDAAQKLQDKLNATEHEVASAYNAGHITDSDRKTWNEIKASNLPANQLKQKLDDFVELLNGKRDSLNHMYQQTFHEDAPTIDKESNAAITAKIHQRLPNYSNSQTGLPSGWSVKVH